MNIFDYLLFKEAVARAARAAKAAVGATKIPREVQAYQQLQQLSAALQKHIEKLSKSKAVRKMLQERAARGKFARESMGRMFRGLAELQQKMDPAVLKAIQQLHTGKTVPRLFYRLRTPERYLAEMPGIAGAFARHPYLTAAGLPLGGAALGAGIAGLTRESSLDDLFDEDDLIDELIADELEKEAEEELLEDLLADELEDYYFDNII